MKRLIKIFAITSVLGISFLAFANKDNLSDANKDNSSDEKIATDEVCDTQFEYGQPLGSTTENGQKINICPRL
ncbi:hypothetical protein QE177_05470 [Arsenophonus sp. aPb]|uniref:hypothetical protein n=1 Tax=Arsenophonus sp. aPb TaxID=3041619 RepID=UPI002469ACFF|nr:hypothetical protein [Arsenophonus sp. aPb]WGL99327.1 hypothetical protein QE177_05470 [Arsenophonus sp. aPb]